VNFICIIKMKVDLVLLLVIVGPFLSVNYGLVPQEPQLTQQQQQGRMVMVEKIPIGAVFEQGSTQVQSAFKYALGVANAGLPEGGGISPHVNVINTADAFKLSRISEDI
jgi:hypothetical protein